MCLTVQTNVTNPGRLTGCFCCSCYYALSRCEMSEHLCGGKLAVYSCVSQSVHGMCMIFVWKTHIYDSCIEYVSLCSVTGVKGDFCSHLNTFLGKLTDLRYKLAGLTAIHVPKEGIGLSIEQAARDKRLIKRIEGIMCGFLSRN